MRSDYMFKIIISTLTTTFLCNTQPCKYWKRQIIHGTHHRDLRSSNIILLPMLTRTAARNQLYRRTIIRFTLLLTLQRTIAAIFIPRFTQITSTVAHFLSCLSVGSIPVLNKPVTILIRRVLNADVVKLFHLSIKLSLPHFLEPSCSAKPFHQSRADRIVEADKNPTVPCLGEYIVTVPPQRPYLRTIIRTIHSGSDIASARR